jgi:hypothetical protein
MSTGRYWYVDELASGSADKMTTQSWYTHDGTVYTMIPQDKRVFLASPHAGFSVGASSLTYQQIRQLPTNPAALTAWITRSFARPSDPPATPGGAPRAVYSPPPRADISSAVAISLSELLDQIPAPRAVRAAAFRALAAMPDVTKLDEVGGDVVLRISAPALPAGKFPGGKVPAGTGEIRLMIDASTLTLHAWSDYTGTITVLASRWTNTLPRIIPDSQLAHPPGATRRRGRGGQGEAAGQPAHPPVARRPGPRTIPGAAAGPGCRYPRSGCPLHHGSPRRRAGGLGRRFRLSQGLMHFHEIVHFA